jgi:hypothetical protein
LAGRAGDACAVHGAALAASRRTFGEAHGSTLRDMQLLAESTHAAGDAPEAAKLYAVTTQALKEALGRFHPRTVLALQQHAQLCMEAADYAQAEALCEEAVAGFRQLIGGAWAQRQHWHHLVDSLNMLADLRARAGRLAEAEALLREAVAAAHNKAVPKQDAPLRPKRSSAMQLVRVLGMRRCFDDALSLLQQMQLQKMVNLRNWVCHCADLTDMETNAPVVEMWRECMQLQWCAGALLQGAGRYTQAADVFSSVSSLRCQSQPPAGPMEELDATCVAAKVADSADLLAQLQQQHQLPFAHHCHTLSLLLRAAALCPPLRISMPPLQPALHSLQQLWRRFDCSAHERTPPAQRRRLLGLASCAHALALRLSAAAPRSSMSSRSAQAAAARVLRRCCSARGAQALLSTCAPPPEFACA